MLFLALLLLLFVFLVFVSRFSVSCVFCFFYKWNVLLCDMLKGEGGGWRVEGRAEQPKKKQGQKKRLRQRQKQKLKLNCFCYLTLRLFCVSRCRKLAKLLMATHVANARAG